MINIVNRHTYSGAGVYVGRPSALGGAFKLKQHGGKYTREESIALYREWLREQYKTGGAAKQALLALVSSYKRHGQLTLICSCAPLACHADVIKDAIVGICAKQNAKEVTSMDINTLCKRMAGWMTARTAERALKTAQELGGDCFAADVYIFSPTLTYKQMKQKLGTWGPGDEFLDS